MDPEHASASSRLQESAGGSDTARRPEETPAVTTQRPVTVQSPQDAALLAELLQKLGSVEKAMEVYALFTASQTSAAAVTPPPPIPEESPAQTVVSQDEPQTSTGAPDFGTSQTEAALRTDSPGTVVETVIEETVTVTEETVTEETVTEEKATEGGGAEAEQEKENPSVEGEKEGETPVLEKIAEGETPVFETVAEGETPVSVSMAEGETPVEKTAEGDETPTDFRGDTPERVEGGTPVASSVDKTPEGETPVQDDVLIVDLVDDPEEVETPVDERTARRRTRRNLLDEVEGRTPSTEGVVPGQGEVGRGDETPRSTAETEEGRLTRERKRKGKQVSLTQHKKSKRVAMVKASDDPIPPTTKVPFAKELSGPRPSGESDSEEVEEPEEEPNFERTEVWITKELLEAMRKFDDPKRAATYKERSSAGKMAKSGKRYDPRELQDIESDDEFRACISAIGFEWLLKHSTTEVPVDLAREFFSTFRLRNTTDVDADAISFRLFGEEYEMSIREWSLRMGLFSRAEDEEGTWNERMLGAPKYTPGFQVKEAWELVTHANAGAFKSSYSKASHIDDRILRFAQTFISYNLMGTANSALTTTDLYFTWCMARKVKVHLGYWLAQACHQMTGNPSRHMYTCHLLGAYLQRNIVVKIAKTAPEVLMCEPPEIFSVEYFFNKGLLQTQGKEIFFYDVGDVPKVKPESAEAAPSEEVEELNREMRKDVREMRKAVVDVRREMGDMRKDIRKEMGELSREICGMKTELAALRGMVHDVVAKCSRQNERMTEAVELMMKMTKWVERSLPQIQPKLLSGPSSQGTQPGQGSTILQRPPATQPEVTPPASRSLTIPAATTTPSATKSVSAPPESRPPSTRKPMMTRPRTEEKEPETSARKKVKMTRPTIPPTSGSRGGQTQK